MVEYCFANDILLKMFLNSHFVEYGKIHHRNPHQDHKVDRKKSNYLKPFNLRFFSNAGYFHPPDTIPG
jgi:hypothetical protein